MTAPLELIAPNLPGALCAETDPEAFFPEKGDSARGPKKVCAECPVRLPCLEWALTAQEPHGIWGGLSPRERHGLRVTRPMPASLDRRVPPKLQPINHGTDAGYAAHNRRKEPMCAPCREAHNVAVAERAARRAARGAA